MFLSKVFANLIFQSLVTYGFAKATIEDPKMSKAVDENALTYMVAWFVALLMFAFTKNIITRFMLFTALSAVAGMFLGTRGKRDVKETLLDAVTIFITMFVLGVVTRMLNENSREVLVSETRAAYAEIRERRAKGATRKLLSLEDARSRRLCVWVQGGVGRQHRQLVSASAAAQRKLAWYG